MKPLPIIIVLIAATVSLVGVTGIAVGQTYRPTRPDSTNTAKRKIPVRGYARPASNRVLKESPGEQPGEVTSVEIRNEAGELIDGELDEGEYFLGAAPIPVRIGQPLPNRLTTNSDSTPAVTAGMRLHTPDMGADSEGLFSEPSVSHLGIGDSVIGNSVIGDSPCTQCDGGSCDGNGECSSYGHESHLRGAHIDARVERIARVLANPMVGFWARADYMQLILDGQNVPALVTTSPAGTLRTEAGVLGQTGTRVLFGNDELADGERSGARFEIGKYFHGESGLGISASFMFAEDENQRFSADSSQFSILARPFVDVSPTGVGDNAELIAFNGDSSGEVNVQASTSFAAADVLLRGVLICEPDRQLEGFVGYAYYGLNDDVTINDFRRVVTGTGGLAIGTTLAGTDNFSVDNDFHGAALGVRSQTCFGGWSLSTMLKLGLGVTTSNLNINGSTTTTVPLAGGATDVATRNSGLLVQDSNSGSQSFDEFAVAPELGLTLSRRMNRDWTVSAGYQLIYLSRVMRAGEQIDPLLNLSQLTVAGLNGTARPSRSGFYNDLTAQAITIGLMREF